MTFSWISLLQVITHIFRSRYLLGTCVAQVGDLLLFHQEVIVDPVVEPQHLAEKRHTFSRHRPPPIGVTDTRLRS